MASDPSQMPLCVFCGRCRVSPGYACYSCHRTQPANANANILTPAQPRETLERIKDDPPKRPTTLVCQDCATTYAGYRNSCPNCGLAVECSDTGLPDHLRVIGDGTDWQCQDCGRYNNANQLICFICSRTRPFAVK